MGERRAGYLTHTGNDVDHAVRDADFLCKVRHVKGGEWRVLGRFHHAGVAGGHRGSNAPAAKQKWKVPGHNKAARTPGMSHHGRLMTGNRNGGIQGESLCQTAKIPDGINKVLHIISRLGLDLAAVQRLDLCDDGFALFHGIREPHEVHTAFIHRQARPVGFVECLLGGGNGSFDVVRLHVGHGGECLPGPGVAGGEGVPIGGGHLLAADHGAVNFLGKKHLHLGKQCFTGSGLHSHDNE